MEHSDENVYGGEYYDSFDSSFILGTNYEHDDKKLRIDMKSGNSYTYSDVGSDIVEHFIAASSKGWYYNEYIKGRYRSHRNR
jgi:hypothetical protein